MSIHSTILMNKSMECFYWICLSNFALKPVHQMADLQYSPWRVGHEKMLIFNIQTCTFFNFQFRMFEYLLTPSQRVFDLVINL